MLAGACVQPGACRRLGCTHKLRCSDAACVLRPPPARVAPHMPDPTPRPPQHRHHLRVCACVHVCMQELQQALASTSAQLADARGAVEQLRSSNQELAAKVAEGRSRVCVEGGGGVGAAHVRVRALACMCSSAHACA